MPTAAITAFKRCAEAIEAGQLIHRASSRDKEFHFQDWFGNRLTEANLAYDQHGRNTYPDFTLVATPEGFEVKGLAWPGRSANYDSNSQVPSGYHNGRAIYYVFGRYPANEVGNEFPVIDLVICHGDFLNADHEYIHKNRNVKGFGSYGDLIIRDRKMYVAPTPFALTHGTTGQKTLIVPAGTDVAGLKQVGEIVRRESDSLIIGYRFDLRTNELIPELAENPSRGTEHVFVAYRVEGASDEPVTLLDPNAVLAELAASDEEAEPDD